MINSELYIGTIQSYDPESRIGIIDMAGSMVDLNKKFYEIDYVDVSFNMSMSSIPLTTGKIVVYQMHLNVADGTSWGKNLQDFNPVNHAPLSRFLLKGLDTNSIINPDHNPYLFDFFIEHNFVYRAYQSDLIRIRKLDSLIDNFLTFDKNVAVSKYQVKVKETAIYRARTDDVAAIGIKTTRNYFPDDPYLDSLLPESYDEIVSERAFISCDIILNELWKQLGGDMAKKGLENKCEVRQENLVQYFLQVYNKETHLETLHEVKNKISREMRGKIEANYRQKTLFY